MMDFCKFVNRKIQASNGKPFEVKNPVIDEVLTEKWEEDEQNYTDFVNMMEALTEDLNKLNSDATNASVIKQLQAMFGENITNDAVKKNAEKLNSTFGWNGNCWGNWNIECNKGGCCCKEEYILWRVILDSFLSIPDIHCQNY